MKLYHIAHCTNPTPAPQKKGGGIRRVSCFGGLHLTQFIVPLFISFPNFSKINVTFVIREKILIFLMKKVDRISLTQSIYIVLFKDSTILTAKKDT